ncbi:MAG TPA: (2Fe-2S)-binding protein [Anaerolineaceae bacterium]|nr:(2Fe-2S)-binding protein [Anaerolineaceae bacterium]
MQIQMTVNHQPVTLEIRPDEMLADVLRDRLGLLGTKVACREGECGACTVVLDGQAVVSCLMPAVKATGCEIITIEGLGNTENPHPIQQRMAEYGAAQCGYCTPGFVMSTYSLLAENPHPTREQIVEELSGNLCRCTGYTKIIDAVEALAKEEVQEDQS